MDDILNEVTNENDDTPMEDEIADRQQQQEQNQKQNLPAVAELHLTLENFDSDSIPDDCPYVLTSPRSLEACRIQGVKV